MNTEAQSEFVRWSLDEIRRAGLFDEDSDYNGMLGQALQSLVLTFDAQGHSGMSAALVGQIFYRLVQRRALGPLTNNPEEWMDVASAAGRPSVWQSKRQPSAFSHDGGQTYYDLDEEIPWWRTLLGRVRGKYLPKTHKTVPGRSQQ